MVVDKTIKMRNNKKKNLAVKVLNNNLKFCFHLSNKESFQLAKLKMIALVL